MNPEMNFQLLDKLSWRWRKEGVMAAQINTLTTVSINKHGFFHQLPTQKGLVRGLLSSHRMHKSSLELEDAGPLYSQIGDSRTKGYMSHNTSVSQRDNAFARGFNLPLFSSASFPFLMTCPQSSFLERLLGFQATQLGTQAQEPLSPPADNFARGRGVNRMGTPHPVADTLLLQGSASEMDQD